ncbi:MAG: hypothetical protein H6597_03050 [Flavobacteriales bacterium]|nr:hypothetical protein [Flavobacteriales bacterium]MCB9193484.1 hypothetical protein [Flavobacteriales bacterium]
MRFPTVLIACCLLVRAFGQCDTTDLPCSENGWYLSPHGTIRVLVIFAEIDYDKNPSGDPADPNAEHWRKGELPRWKDDLFEPFPTVTPKAMVTKYYHDISLGQFTVLGDYVDRIVTIKESTHSGLNNAMTLSRAAVEEANGFGALRTAHHLGVADFDLWKRGGKPGLPKAEGPDDPHSYDHVMVILRNSSLGHGRGSTDPGSPGELFGYQSDTESRFGGMNALPFEILKHEFNHLLLGGNNFHSGGGNAAQFQSYFIPLQGGWSMMGASSSSLLTCSGWDRDRLGWRAPDALFRVNARNQDGRTINSDIDPVEGDTGIFVLRDFVTSGDALRIRLPYLEKGAFPQWIWVENHQTHAHNGSPTDRFHWEDTGNPCIEPAAPGLYMQVQVDRDDKTGRDIYGGDADYLHPLTACGHFDLRLSTDTLKWSCPFGGTTVAYVESKDMENPLTGNCEQELPVYDRDHNHRLDRGEHFIPNAAIRGGRVHDNAIFFGRTEQAFTLDGVRKLGMGTNPSSANVLTLVSAGGRARYQGALPDDRVVHLNGISIELIDMDDEGHAHIRVRNDDTRIDQDRRWCGDSIVLAPIRGHSGYALELAAGRRITFDRSLTPTRVDQPETVAGTTYFSDPTRFVVLPGARVRLEEKAKWVLENGSEVHLMPGAHLELDTGAEIIERSGSHFIVHEGAEVVRREKQKRGCHLFGKRKDQRDQ